MIDIKRDLIEKWKSEDSISKKRRLCNRYLSHKIKELESILAHESLDDFDFAEILSELYEDLCMVQTQIQLDYCVENVSRFQLR